MKTALLVILLAAAAPSATVAQSTGAAEYANSCASCHGPDGTGNGPLAGFLNKALPDLTQLAAGNGGVFPLTRVYQTIEGSMTPGAHGTREMPVWGNRYKSRAADTANPDFSTEEVEVFARFRILALTEYLATIQE